MYNLEEQGLKYYLAPPEVFEEYGVSTSDSTRLQSGNVFKHIALCGDMAVFCHGDLRVVPFTQDALVSYIEYVDGYVGGNNE